MSGTIVRGAVLRNAFNDETFIFSGPTDNPDAARFDVVLGRDGSGGGDALVHVHPGADEHFAVKSGRVRVVIDGRATIVGPGERAVAPRDRPHHFANAGDTDAELTIEFRPAQDHLRFFANFAALAERHPGWFSARGRPHLLLIALTLHAYRDHLYLAGLPVWAQKALFAMLAPVALWRGYRVEIPPVPARAA